MLVSLTDAGRALRERAFNANLRDACGLTGDEFAETRDAVLKLRNNLANSLDK